MTSGQRSALSEISRLEMVSSNGQVIPTGAEGQEAERQRADQLAKRLRAMGINPDKI